LGNFEKIIDGRAAARGFSPAARFWHCICGGSTGHVDPRFQVLALSWILPLFTPTNTFFFEKSADQRIYKFVDLPCGVLEGYFRDYFKADLLRLW